MADIKKTLELLQSHAAQVVPHDILQKKLSKNKPLKIKLGMDPTSPDLHLGHAVVLSKMKQFQDLGHEVIFVIGDFTARIGDPSGKSKTRPCLTEDEIKKNTQTYFEQVSKILDPKKVTVRYNSEWLGKLTATDIVQLCAKITLARLIERDDFAKRIKEQVSVGFHELLYPIFQGYDSVALEADIELGGTDQTFNLLVGRYLQEQFGQEPQGVLTMPLLEGLDGVAKMSKSLGNAIGITEPPQQAFGKLMSISDTLMWRYFEVLLQKSSADISQMQARVAAGNLHPMALKKEMAHSIIEKFWSKAEAEKAQENFQALFEKKDYSQAQEVALPKQLANPVWIVELLKALGALKSSSDAKRLIESNAVSIDGDVIADFKAEITWKSGMIIKVGKHRFYKVA